jgi:hypothetical protein
MCSDLGSAPTEVLDDLPFPPFANPCTPNGTGSTGRATQCCVYATRLRIEPIPAEELDDAPVLPRHRSCGSTTRRRIPRPDPIRSGTSAKSKGASSLVLALNTLDPAPCLVVNKLAMTNSVLRSRSVHELEPLSEYHMEVDQWAG